METKIKELEQEILQLKNTLIEKQKELIDLKNKSQEKCNGTISRWAIERYSRQALLYELGSPKEILCKLMNSSVLIIGAGGLGCPASTYLAGAGIGHIGIVDYDEVEITNLHRQPLHPEFAVGISKVESALMSLKSLNPNIKVTPYNLQLDSSNALSIVSKYDVVIDATDNAVTRYLINDACVLSKKPLVSAAALQLSGQFTTYNYPPRDINVDDEESERCPCYRCLFPTPPPAEAVGSCSQNGVLGPVPGVMGCLEAIEAIKIILKKTTMAGYLLMFDASDWTFTKIKLRKRNPDCLVCSKNPSITKLIDYELFCNAQASDKYLNLKILSSTERLNALEFRRDVFTRLHELDFKEENDGIKNKALLIDVRSDGEFEMCNLSKSINRPIDKIDYDELIENVKNEKIGEVYFICRRGNDSQIAAKQFNDTWNKSFGNSEKPVIKDIIGGLHAWSKFVDSNFPTY